MALTREQVPEMLRNAGIDPSAASLYGAHDDGVVIDSRPTGWVVFVSDRGAEYDRSTHHSEHDACVEALRRLGIVWTP